ncbi:MAG TPA: glycosyltransferase family 9 protein [Candidatus Kapabacteria bacterium]|nr:glycosyltransferase family 9 protein [Candidatus Kapabacteria bacterium]
MTEQRQSYRYRPQNPHVVLPWHKELGKKIERVNKILTLRLLGKILRIKPVTSPLPLEKVSSVLIIRYDALGDMIVTTPLWRILKRHKPSIKIGVAGSFKNLDLLRADTDIDTLYDYTASSLRDFVRLSRQTRKEKWDVVLMGNFNQKTRNSIISRLATTNGITATIGAKNKEGHQALFSRLVSLPETDFEMPMTEKLQFLLRSTIELPSEQFERPSIIVDPVVERETSVKIKTILEQENITKYIVLNTDAPAFKRWGTGKNIQLASYISTHYPEYAVLMTALPNYGKEIELHLSSQHIPRVHYFPTDDIHAMTTLIRHSELVVTPDTSIVHLASAENKPVVAFYLAVGEWAPYDIPAYILLPKSGEPISSIPLDSAEEGIRTMLTIGLPPGEMVRTVRCER